MEIGGSLGRDGATGRGVIFCLEELTKKIGIPINSKLTIAIQGFGNVGSDPALYAHEMGARVVAVSDANGGIYHSEGLDIPKLIEHYKANKNLKGFSDVRIIANKEELLTLKVMVLIPAALEGTITKKMLHKFKLKLLWKGLMAPSLN